MALISVETSNVLRDPKARGVFEAVAKPRTISLRDLKSSFSSDEDLQESIAVLKEADLIGEKPAVIQDFSTLYVTANGLNAVLALNKL
jgi:hypothetical protein